MFKKRDSIWRECTKCGQVKREEQFYRDRRRKDGLGSQCKACINSHRRNKDPKKLEINMAAIDRLYR